MMSKEYFGRHSDITLRVSPPPTEVLKEMFDRRNPEEAAAKAFLPQNEARPCCMYSENVDVIMPCHFPFLSQGIHVV